MPHRALVFGAAATIVTASSSEGEGGSVGAHDRYCGPRKPDKSYY